MRKLLAVLCVGFAFIGSAKAEEKSTEVPARTRFVVALTARHQIPTDGLVRDRWAFLQIEGKPRLCLVDLEGRVYEHRLVSRDRGVPVPTELTVEGGRLFVRSEGRTYKYSPHGRIVGTMGIAPVTHQWWGPFGACAVTVPGVVSTPVYVEDTQWVEVLTTTVVAPTPVPTKKREPQPTPVDEQELREETPAPPALVVPPTAVPKGSAAEEGDKPLPQPQKSRSRPRIA